LGWANILRPDAVATGLHIGASLGADDLAHAAEAAAIDAVDRDVALVVRQGHGEPGGAFNRVLDVLVGGADDRMARARFQLGEEITPESGGGAQARLLGFELGPRQRGVARGDVGRRVALPEANAAPVAAGRHAQNRQREDARDGTTATGPLYRPCSRVSPDRSRRSTMLSLKHYQTGRTRP